MKKIEHDVVLGVVKLLDILLLGFPFSVCWFAYYTAGTAASLFYWGNWLATALFSILYFNFSRIYDALLISCRQISEMVYSQVLAVLCADGIMFLFLYLLTGRPPSLFPAAAVPLEQGLLALLWSVLARKWYFSTFPAQSAAVVCGAHYSLERLVREHGLDRKFDIQVAASVEDCMKDIHVLDDMNAVFFCGVQSHERNLFLKYCVERDIPAYVIPRIGDALMSSGRWVHMFHLPVLRVERYRPSPSYLLTKRLLDILFSAAALLALSPLMLLTAVSIKLADGGPVLYKQVRLTKDGKRFHMLKFRSMRVDAEEDGVARLSTGDSDGRVTRIGRVIRKVRIDELPQLLCILAGTMSAVGPRPERPEIAAQYEEELPEFALRLQAKAGLTGYAQVYGKYNTTPYDKLQMDLMYIAHPSILKDIRIILATVKVLLKPESTEGVAAGQTTASAGSLLPNTRPLPCGTGGGSDENTDPFRGI